MRKKFYQTSRLIYLWLMTVGTLSWVIPQVANATWELEIEGRSGAKVTVRVVYPWHNKRKLPLVPDDISDAKAPADEKANTPNMPSVKVLNDVEGSASPTKSVKLTDVNGVNEFALRDGASGILIFPDLNTLAGAEALVDDMCCLSCWCQSTLHRFDSGFDHISIRIDGLDVGCWVPIQKSGLHDASKKWVYESSGTKVTLQGSKTRKKKSGCVVM